MEDIQLLFRQVCAEIVIAVLNQPDMGQLDLVQLEQSFDRGLISIFPNVPIDLNPLYKHCHKHAAWSVEKFVEVFAQVESRLATQGISFIWPQSQTRSFGLGDTKISQATKQSQSEIADILRGTSDPKLLQDMDDDLDQLFDAIIDEPKQVYAENPVAHDRDLELLLDSFADIEAIADNIPSSLDFDSPSSQEPVRTDSRSSLDTRLSFAQSSSNIDDIPQIETSTNLGSERGQSEAEPQPDRDEITYSQVADIIEQGAAGKIGMSDAHERELELLLDSFSDIEAFSSHPDLSIFQDNFDKQANYYAENKDIYDNKQALESMSEDHSNGFVLFDVEQQDPHDGANQEIKFIEIPASDEMESLYASDDLAAVEMQLTPEIGDTFRAEERPLTQLVSEQVSSIDATFREQIAVFLLNCLRDSALRGVLPLEPFAAFVRSELDEMIDQDGQQLDLQIMLEGIQEIPYLSEKMILSAFMKIHERQAELPITINFPASIQGAISRAAVATSGTFRSMASLSIDEATGLKPRDTASAKPHDTTSAKPRDTTSAKPHDTTSAKPHDTTSAKPRDTASAKPHDTTSAKPQRIAIPSSQPIGRDSVSDLPASQQPIASGSFYRLPATDAKPKFSRDTIPAAKDVEATPPKRPLSKLRKIFAYTLIVIALSFHYLMSPEPDIKVMLRGEPLNPLPFNQQIIPTYEVRLDNNILYLQVTNQFDKLSNDQKISALFALQELANEQHQAKIVIVLDANGQLYAAIGKEGS